MGFLLLVDLRFNDLTLDGLASVGAVVLAGVLAWAAILKLVDRPATTDGFVLLGLPHPATAAVVVPGAELAIAGVLLLVPGWGGVAAFVLLSGFTTFLVSMIRSGTMVPCRCFGSSGEAAASTRDVARNVVLLMLAAFATSLDGLMTPSARDCLAAAGIAAVLVVGISQLGRPRDA